MLPQNSSYQERKHKLRWLVMLSTLPLLGVVTAFGLVPQDEILSLSETDVVSHNITLPEVIPEADTVGTYWHVEKVQHGDTVAELLRRLNVNDAEASKFLRHGKDADSLRKLRVGREIQSEITTSGSLVALRYLNNDGNQTTISKAGESFKVVEQKPIIEERVIVRSGTIRSSLYGATDAAGVPDRIANQLAEIFGGEIDYHNDLRRGDTFSVVFEATYKNGGLVKSGRILAAEFNNKNKTHQAIYYQGSHRSGSYYTADGRSTKKAFLRSPIAFSRVTSGFTTARFHPVLKKWRAHKGVDFGAPRGTAVRATGDGVVHTAETQRGYGNVVIISHVGGKYSTLYGHLNGFAKGVRKGQRIEQGDVIGYVGSTGLASGPHLHYEFKVGGIQKDPMSLALPISVPLEGKDRTAFKKTSQQMLAMMNSSRGNMVASAE